MEGRINLNDDHTNIFIKFKLAKGNPGALAAMTEMCNAVPTVDPDFPLRSLGILQSLDNYGIYGTDIYVLFSDICGRNAAKAIAVLRAVQLGFFTREILADACHRQDYSGRDMVPVDELCEKVKEQLPGFNL